MSKKSRVPKASTGSTCSQVDTHSPDLEERIRRRAFEIYELRGRVDGYADEDWLQAEQELLAGRPTKLAS